MALRLRYVAHSEIGLIRKNNQDSGFASPHLLVVADGMGGAAAGDLASAVAIDTIKRIESPSAGEEMLEVLAGAIHRANDRIADLVDADPALDGMGTTVTGALFDGSDLGVAHIGDSRAYLLRAGLLERLTHDHSWVQSLVDDGKISDAEASVHPHRSLLLKVLNGQGANDPDLTMVRVELGDRVMFCSDGVCGLVNDPEIHAALLRPDLHDALDELVAEALAEGGVDNITVIVADVVDEIATAEAGAGAAETTEAETTESIVLGAAAERVIPAAETRLRDAAPDEDATFVNQVLVDDHEDTLIRARPLLAEPAAADAADEARYNPVPPARRRLRRPLIAVVVLVLVLGAALGTAYAWTRTQYFVGASGDKVAIFQGLSETVPGVPLSRLYQIQDLAIADLPPYYQDKVRANIDVSSLQSAKDTVAELTEAVRRCVGRTPGGAGSASPTPAAPKPTDKATDKATGKPSSPSTTTPTSSASGSAEPGC